MSNGGRKLCYCNMWVTKCEMEALESERIEHVEEKSCQKYDGGNEKENSRMGMEKMNEIQVTQCFTFR